MFLWTVVLFIRGQNSRRHAPDQNQALADEFTWVFMVPALNEEVTIADSVERLLAVEVRDKRIVVIDDGSEDSTPQILAGISHPALVPLRREKPNAQTGKASALNWAYRQLGELLAGRRPRSRDRRDRRRRRSPAHGRAVLDGGALRRPSGRRRSVAGADLQPPQAARLVSGRRVRRLRRALPERPQRLGHCRHGRERAVQPALRAETTLPTRPAPGATS